MKEWALKIKKIWKDTCGKISPLWNLIFSSRLISRIDRYLIVKFLGTYIFSILLIISIAVVFDFNENLDRFMQHNAPFDKLIFEYYLNFIPYYSNLFSALFVFISVIFFTSKLADNSEIIAMMSTGMSFKRIMRPYLIGATIIAIFTYMLGAYVIPRGTSTRLNFENTYKKKKIVTYAQDIQLEVDTGVIAYIERFERSNKTGYHFSLDKFVDKKLVSHMTASTITYDTLSDVKYHWTIRDYTVRELKGLKEYISYGNRTDSIIKMEPEDFLISEGQEATMTSPELKEYIQRQKNRGFANIKQFEVEYYKRIAMSFAAYILTIIGLSLSAQKRKGGMGMYMGLGLALSVSYILFQTISSSFAINANVPPIIAVWIPNIVFIFIALYLFKKAPK